MIQNELIGDCEKQLINRPWPIDAIYICIGALFCQYNLHIILY